MCILGIKSCTLLLVLALRSTTTDAASIFSTPGDFKLWHVFTGAVLWMCWRFCSFACRPVLLWCFND